MIIVYDPTLVMLSIIVAVTGCLTGLALTSGFGQADKPYSARSLMKGAIVIGGSIWSMHFIAMLAVKFPVRIEYNFVETILSLYVAILFTGVGLYIVSKRRLGPVSIPAAGLLMGCGIAGMHYLGMGAIRGCGLSYNLPIVLLSVGIAVAAASVALWFAFRERGVMETLVGSLALGLAIPGMHYTGMLATSFYNIDITLEATTPLLSQDMLAFLVASATLAICGVYLVLFSWMAIQEQ